MRKKTRIAFYCSSLTKGGAERVFVNLAEYFNAQGYEVFIVTPYRYEDEYIISSAVTRILSDLTQQELKKGRIRNIICRISKLRRIFRQIHPDIVFSCNGKNNFMAMSAVAFTRGRVVVSVVADPKMEYYNSVMRFLAKTLFCFADGIVFQTEEAKRFFPKGVQKKSIILPNSLNPVFIRPRYEGKRKKEIVAVGRLDENKNHAMLIQAFAGITERFPDYFVTVYGEGEKRPELERLIFDLDMGEKVSLPGRTDRIEDRIYQSSLFVMTSDTEGMPNALMEAMALGLPVISTDCPCGGPRELITNEKNGYLIPVRDTEALRNRLEYCLTHTAEMDRVGREAAKIQDKLNPERVNREWESYFFKVMGKEKTGC